MPALKQLNAKPFVLHLAKPRLVFFPEQYCTPAHYYCNYLGIGLGTMLDLHFDTRQWLNNSKIDWSTNQLHENGCSIVILNDLDLPQIILAFDGITHSY